MDGSHQQVETEGALGLLLFREGISLRGGALISVLLRGFQLTQKTVDLLAVYQTTNAAALPSPEGRARWEEGSAQAPADA